MIIAILIIVKLFLNGTNIPKNYIFYYLLLVILFFINPSFTSLVYLVAIGLMIVWLFSLYNISRYRNFIFGLIFLFSLVPIYDGSSYSGIYGNNIFFAGTIIFATYLNNTTKSNLLKYIFYLIFFYLIIIAESKTHIALFFLYFLFIQFKKIIFNYKSLFFIITLCSPFIFLYIVQNFIIDSNLGDVRLGGRSVFDLSGRTSVYSIINEFISMFPFGIGLGNSAEILQDGSFGFVISSTHNAWIKLIFEASIIGLLGFIILMIKELKKINNLGVIFIILLNIKFSFDIFTPLSISLLTLIYFYPIIEYYSEKT